MEEIRNEVKQEKRITNKDLMKVWWRWVFFQEASVSYERLQAPGFFYAISPVLVKLYGDNPEELTAACKRHMQFYNSEPYCGLAIHGITLALEEERANGAPISDEAINSLKTGLMGPLAGIGDTINHGLLETRNRAAQGGKPVVGSQGHFVHLAENNLLAKFAGLAHALDLFFDAGNVHLIGSGFIGQRLDERKHFFTQSFVFLSRSRVHRGNALIAVLFRFQPRDLRVLFRNDAERHALRRHGRLLSAAKNTTEIPILQKGQPTKGKSRDADAIRATLRCEFSHKKDLQNFPRRDAGFLGGQYEWDGMK